jgi:hypothetical protein
VVPGHDVVHLQGPLVRGFAAQKPAPQHSHTAAFGTGDHPAI